MSALPAFLVALWSDAAVQPGALERGMRALGLWDDDGATLKAWQWAEIAVRRYEPELA